MFLSNQLFKVNFQYQACHFGKIVPKYSFSWIP